MNILPLVLALVLMLSLLTVEKLEHFKNQAIVQREYQVFLKMNERAVFNQRQKSLFGITEKSLRQLSFRFLVDKQAREKNPSAAAQYRMLMIELMKIVYGEATFFKDLEKKRPHFIEEMLDAIEHAAEEAPKETIKRIQDIARLNLEDSELQQAFYHMLKGTISKGEREENMHAKPSIREKSYVSLFTFIHYNGKDKTPPIVIQRAPREILKAIFMNDEVVEAIIAKRNELSKGEEMQFEKEFMDKRRPGLDNKLLDFRLSDGNKSDYN